MNETARTWGLRLLALGIAIGIWFNASLQDRLASSERLVEAGVSYNRSRGFMIINPVPTVNVRLAGSKKAIRKLSPLTVGVTVELPQRQEGMVTINLGPESVTAPEGLEVVSIEPSSIRVELAREITQRLPVVAKLTGEPAAGAVAGEPEIFPSQVMVSGPDSMLSRIDHLSTVSISLDGRAITFELSVPVVTPDPLIQIVQPTQVSVKIPMSLPDEPKLRATKTKPRKDKR
ncbi:MAG TPA: CdaR family protein [Thermoanaerobaculia bacterium]|jgi:YbbR domain-containing protein|nr:CdaR family protein [Thermoanaerobaculia bacterium]